MRSSTSHFADKRTGGDLHQHVRSQTPRRTRYASGQERRGTIKNRVGIDKRPEIVDQKTRMGDWEGDTVIGMNHKGGLITLAERTSLCVGGTYTQQIRGGCNSRNNAPADDVQR